MAAAYAFERGFGVSALANRDQALKLYSKAARHGFSPPGGIDDLLDGTHSLTLMHIYIYIYIRAHFHGHSHVFSHSVSTV